MAHLSPVSAGYPKLRFLAISDGSKTLVYAQQTNDQCDFMMQSLGMEATGISKSHDAF